MLGKNNCSMYNMCIGTGFTAMQIAYIRKNANCEEPIMKVLFFLSDRQL